VRLPVQHHRSCNALRGNTLRRGMTLLEVLLVVVIIGIIAATAVPSVTSAQQAQTSANIEMVQTLLTTARTRAASEGKPFGVRFVNSSSSSTPDAVWMVVVESSGAAITGARGPGGSASSATDASSVHPSTFISMMNGGSATDETIWFDQLGRPHTRTSTGAFDAYWTTDRSFVFATGTQLVVRRLSGAVEVQ